MNIEIKNCNNIDLANIELSEGKLNIKFAPNGTGKSTIAKAIMYGTAGDLASLSDLMPFKLRTTNPDDKKPEIVGTENINNVMSFDEDYVSQFVFKQDELLNNSFDILIRTESYKINEQEIEKLVAETKQQFTNNQELEILISTLKELGGAFKLTKTGLSKSSTGMKGLAEGNKIQHIPSGLEAFQPFIQSENSVGWIDWQTKGYVFSDLADNCPFCTSHAADKKAQIRKVGQEYNKNTIKNLIGIIDVIERLGEYFSDDARLNLATITTLKEGLEKEHEAFLVSVKTQIDNLIEKLEKIRTLSGFQFKDGEKVSEKMPSYKIDLQFFSELDSGKTKEAITPINEAIDEVIKTASFLQGKINIQRKEMQKVIQKHQKDINGFLTYAGYRYKVEISGEDEQSQLKLLHVDHNVHLSGGSQHLSFGERNAFAIVLFMYECLSKNPDLIILDDPISSFDKNKKYAILEMLFRRDSDTCLKSKTVLMLTHDVEPIIDTIKSLSKQFNNQTSANFLMLSGGQITEQTIAKNDIQTFSQICISALGSDKDDVIKLIYLRRFYEILDDKGDAYQVLSNLFHKRERAIDTRVPKDQNGLHPEMEGDRFTAGCVDIESHLADFSYTNIHNKTSDHDTLSFLYGACQNGYEKLQIFRLFGFDVKNSVIQKFINETYHIENEFISQLDPAKFDTIPEYVIEECNKFVVA
jgi:ABC-type cobalamin/Fe3+-siderophores transport system ATPase subunit